MDTSEPAVDAFPGAACWRKKPGREFHWRDWEGGSVVFELRSGHTYQLAALQAALMACFETSDNSFEDVVHAMAEDLGVGVDDDLRRALSDSMKQLIKLGWIEPIISA